MESLEECRAFFFVNYIVSITCFLLEDACLGWAAADSTSMILLLLSSSSSFAALQLSNSAEYERKCVYVYLTIWDNAKSVW